jgi:hypothetical protein
MLINPSPGFGRALYDTLTRSPTFTDHLHFASGFLKGIQSPLATIKHHVPAIARGNPCNEPDTIRLTAAKETFARKITPRIFSARLHFHNVTDFH